MASVKATFTLDDDVVSKLAQAAQRTKRPKSAIVREAILDYSERLDRLTEPEKKRMLNALDELMPKVAPRSREDLQAELDEIRRARRSGGRASPS